MGRRMWGEEGGRRLFLDILTADTQGAHMRLRILTFFSDISIYPSADIELDHDSEPAGSSVICRALTRLLDESTLSMENIDIWDKLIEAAGRWLATTMTAEDVDVVGALLGRIGEIRKS